MKNEFFEKMDAVGKAYEEARRVAKAHKEEIIETFGWDSDELKAWYKAEEADKEAMPYGAGAWKAFRAWYYNREGEFQLDDFLWQNEVQEFVETLKKAGIKSFVYTNTSTALMENMHGFVEAGCTMDGLCKIKRVEDRWGQDETVEIQGIRFLVGGAA